MPDTDKTPSFAFRRSGRNLHICLKRTPDAAALAAVASILSESARDPVRLFLDVRPLDALPARSADGLRKALASSGVPPENVFFKGPLGFSLAREGNRVLVERGAALPSEAARRRFERRACSCGGRCGDRCCRVTGGECCGGRGHEAA